MATILSNYAITQYYVIVNNTQIIIFFQLHLHLDVCYASSVSINLKIFQPFYWHSETFMKIFYYLAIHRNGYPHVLNQKIKIKNKNIAQMSGLKQH